MIVPVAIKRNGDQCRKPSVCSALAEMAEVGGVVVSDRTKQCVQ